MEKRKVLSISLNEMELENLDEIRNYFLETGKSEFFREFIREKSDSQFLKWLIDYQTKQILSDKGA